MTLSVVVRPKCGQRGQTTWMQTTGAWPGPDDLDSLAGGVYVRACQGLCVYVAVYAVTHQDQGTLRRLKSFLAKTWFKIFSGFGLGHTRSFNAFSLMKVATARIRVRRSVY
jgi:hypothetical protein